MVLKIKNEHFDAGIDLEEGLIPDILHYMAKMSWDEMFDYIESRGWDWELID